VKFIIARLAKILFWTVCWLIIFSAVLLSLARSLTPLVKSYRQHFSMLASKALEHPVNIKHLSASWYHFEPVAKFDKVTVLDTKTNQPILEIDELIVGMDLLKSLWHWQLEPDILVLSGSTLTVESNAAGQVTVNGAYTTHEGGQSKLGFNDVMAWLFSHGQIVLNDISLKFHFQEQLLSQLKIRRVNLNNRGHQHSLRGSFLLQQQHLTPIRFAADLTTGKDASDLNAAELYLAIRHLPLDKVNLRVKEQKHRLAKGSLTTRTWASWNKSGWQSIQSLLTLDDLVIEPWQNKPINIEHLAGNILAERQATGGWSIAGDKLQLSLHGHTWPENEFRLSVGAESQLQNLQINYLNLKDLSFLSNLLPSSGRDLILGLKPQGEIHSLFWQPSPQGMTLAGQFNDISFSHWQHLPGATGLTGKIKLLPKTADLELVGKTTQLDFGNLFSRPLEFDKLNLKLSAVKQTDGWTINSDELWAVNSDLELNALLSLYLPTAKMEPEIQLLAALKAPDAKHAARYYPTGIMHKPLVNWLNTAIVQAKDISATLAWRGKLQDFPYHQPTGVFSINGQIHDATLAYAPDWPFIKHLDAELNFTSKSMDITASAGDTLESRLKHATASIADMTSPTASLQIAAKLEGDAKNAMRFIQESPLKTSLGDFTQLVSLQGDMQTALNLSIPLAHQAEVAVQGEVQLADAILNMPSWQLALEKLQGKFNFNQQGLTKGQLRGSFWDEPAQITIAEGPNKLSSQIKMSGNISAPALNRYLNLQSSSKLEGHTAYSAMLTLDKSTHKQQLTLNTDLKDLALPLPAPFGKTAVEKSPLVANLTFKQQGATQLSFSYAKQLTGQIEWVKNSAKQWIWHGMISLGKERPHLLAKPGLLIIGHLAQFDLQAWRPWLEPLFKNQAKSQVAWQNAPRVSLHIDKLQAFKQRFDDVILRLIPYEKYWRLAIESEQAQGNIILPRQATKNPLIIDFERLYWRKSSQTTANLKPQDLPALSFSCRDFHYANSELGEVQLSIEPMSDGLAIKKLAVINPAFNLYLTGGWQQLDLENYTQVAGNIRFHDLAKSLKIVTINSSIQSSGQAKFNLDWVGKPYEPDLAKLDGDVNLTLGRGQLSYTEAATSAKVGLANLINILSLESLTRKLTLDFGDLTSKGFSFSKLQGDFKLDQGNAYTGNAFFDSNVGYIGFKGRIGLKAKDYDLTLKVVPYITASLPLIATLAGGPIVGAVSFVADKLIKHESEHLSTYNYSLTGSWEQPKIKPIK